MVVPFGENSCTTGYDTIWYTVKVLMSFWRQIKIDIIIKGLGSA